MHTGVRPRRRRQRRSQSTDNDSDENATGDGESAAFVVSSRGFEIRGGGASNPAMPSALQVPPPPLQMAFSAAAAAAAQAQHKHHQQQQQRMLGDTAPVVAAALPAPTARRIDPRRKAREEAANKQKAVAVAPAGPATETGAAAASSLAAVAGRSTRTVQLLDTQSVNATGWFKALTNVHRLMAHQQMAFVNAELRKFHAGATGDEQQQVFDLAFVRENELLQMVSVDLFVGRFFFLLVTKERTRGGCIRSRKNIRFSAFCFRMGRKRLRLTIF